MSERKNILRVEHATMQFGGVVAVDDLSLEVNEGEIVAPTARARPPPSTSSPASISPPTAGWPSWTRPSSGTTPRAR